MWNYLVAILVVCLVPLVAWRVLSIIPRDHNVKVYPDTKNKTGSIMILLGSGGHTGEMLRLLRDLDFTKYTSRVYVHYPNDTVSIRKAMAFEQKKCHDRSKAGSCRTAQIPKAREVGQSWFTTVFSSLRALWFALLVAYVDPDVVCCCATCSSSFIFMHFQLTRLFVMVLAVVSCYVGLLLF